MCVCVRACVISLLETQVFSIHCFFGRSKKIFGSFDTSILAGEILMLGQITFIFAGENENRAFVKTCYML